MDRYSRLRRIELLDPARDFDEIFRLVTQYEFPWDYKQGAAIAFMRDFGVPSISALLHETGEFEQHGQKRYDDTIHGKHDIANDEFIYVLATTIVGPKRWIDRFGWRAMHPHEVESMHRVTTRFGELMGIKGLPSSYDAYERFLDEYEAANFAFVPSNLRVAEATIRIFTGSYPSLMRPVLYRATVALFDEPLREALGLPVQPRGLTVVLEKALRARARALRLMPPRPESRPYRHKAKTYPFGYRLADLGPDWLRR